MHYRPNGAYERLRNSYAVILISAHEFRTRELRHLALGVPFKRCIAEIPSFKAKRGYR